MIMTVRLCSPNATVLPEREAGADDPRKRPVEAAAGHRRSIRVRAVRVAESRQVVVLGSGAIPSVGGYEIEAGAEADELGELGAGR